MDSKLIRDVSAVDPELGRWLAKAAGAGDIVEHFSKRRDLPSLQRTLQVEVQAAIHQFVYDGLRAMGQDVSELQYGTRHPGMEKNQAVKKLAAGVNEVLKKIPMPDKADFWQSESEDENQIG